MSQSCPLKVLHYTDAVMCHARARAQGCVPMSLQSQVFEAKLSVRSTEDDLPLGQKLWHHVSRVQQ